LATENQIHILVWDIEKNYNPECIFSLDVNKSDIRNGIHNFNSRSLGKVKGSQKAQHFLAKTILGMGEFSINIGTSEANKIHLSIGKHVTRMKLITNENVD